MIRNLIDPKKLDYFTFYDHPENDTCWSLAMGADKKVYIGLCVEYTSGGIAQLYNFDTKKEKLNHILDISEITGDYPESGRAPQGKIHFSLCPASDLKIYGSTHLTTPPKGEKFWHPYAMMNDGYKYFKGAYLYYYDSTNDDIECFGIVAPRQGLPLMILDENSGRFFGITYPLSHLITFDMKGRNLIDLGKVSEHYPLSMVHYNEENIFFSDYYGRIVRINPKTLKITFTDTFLSHPKWSDGRLFGMMCDSALGPDKKVYCGGYLNTRIMRFWLEKDKVILEDLGYPLEEKIEGNPIRIVSFVFDKSGNLYHILATDQGSYMMSYNIKDNIINNHGLIIKDNINATGWRAVIDDKDRIYFADIANIPVNLWRFNPNG